jgi:hypothetical protein
MDDALAATERAHADDPERAELVRRARRFKASWIELAEALTQARRGGRWRGWGYGSFEEYARKELFLKQDTVEKLTGSYVFLQRRAPDVLRRDGIRETIPSYQAVDFLRRAEEQDSAPEETLEEIRKRVLEEGAPLPSVAKQYRDVVFPIDAAQRKARDAASLRGAATRLRELLDDSPLVSKRLADEVRGALDRLLGAIGEKAA